MGSNLTSLGLQCFLTCFILLSYTHSSNLSSSVTSLGASIYHNIIFSCKLQTILMCGIIWVYISVLFTNRIPIVYKCLTLAIVKMNGIISMELE